MDGMDHELCNTISKKSRWHSSYVLVYMGPLLIYLLTAVPSIFDSKATE